VEVVGLVRKEVGMKPVQGLCNLHRVAVVVGEDTVVARVFAESPAGRVRLAVVSIPQEVPLQRSLTVLIRNPLGWISTLNQHPVLWV
jgi:hypothetical protein